jgi:hypothetical protein
VLAWRKTFPRTAAIEVLRSAILACNLDGMKNLDMESFVT